MLSRSQREDFEVKCMHLHRDYDEGGMENDPEIHRDRWKEKRAKKENWLFDEKTILQCFVKAVFRSQRWSDNYEPPANFDAVSRKIGRDIQLLRFGFPADGFIRMTLYDLIELMRIWISETAEIQEWIKQGVIASVNALLKATCDDLIGEHEAFHSAYVQMLDMYEKQIKETVQQMDKETAHKPKQQNPSPSGLYNAV